MHIIPQTVLTNLTDAVVAFVIEGSKQLIPGLGMLIDYGERVEMAEKMREIFTRFGELAARMEALEALATIPITQIEVICGHIYVVR